MMVEILLARWKIVTGVKNKIPDGGGGAQILIFLRFIAARLD